MQGDSMKKLNWLDAKQKKPSTAEVEKARQACVAHGRILADVDSSHGGLDIHLFFVAVLRLLDVEAASGKDHQDREQARLRKPDTTALQFWHLHVETLPRPFAPAARSRCRVEPRSEC